MPDHATSTDRAVQTQLDRLWALSAGTDMLGLERITELLARLGNPHHALPPVFHVAGTNGKGSTCAFLRAALEAQRYRVHVYTSPHLVRFNERIRLAGQLIDDTALATLLAEVLDHADGIGASFFEVTTAAAFLAFAKTAADACVVEVGLGGRLDATNIVMPVVTGIAQLGIDHEAFLGNSAEAIAREKAGIAKPGVPLVTMHYDASVAAQLAEVADAAGTSVLAQDDAWTFTTGINQLDYHDHVGHVATALPAMAGPHQPANLALAMAMLRHQRVLPIAPDALATAARTAYWPARMQRLDYGPLTALVPSAELWLDGGHNASAAAAVSAALRVRTNGRAAALIIGMLGNKDAAGLLAPFADTATCVVAVPVVGHAHHSPEELANVARALGMSAETAPDIATALCLLQDTPVILILGSLYLAGTALDLNRQTPE